MGAALTGSSPQLVRCAVAAHAAPHQRTGGHSTALRFSTNQRAGGDPRRGVSDQRGAGLSEASLERGARRRVGGHCAVERVGAAGDGVDTHDIDLGAFRGGGSVDVGVGVVRRSRPPPTNKTKCIIFIHFLQIK